MTRKPITRGKTQKEKEENDLFNEAKVPDTVKLSDLTVEADKTKEEQPKDIIEPEKKTSIFEQMDKKDEEQIRLIEGGVIVDEWFYALEEVPDPDKPEETKIVYGISFAGTMGVAKEQKNIRVVGQPFAEHTDKQWNYTVTAEDTARNISTYGTSSESKYFLDRNGKVAMPGGSPKVNPFARISCLTKAQRNAFRKLLEDDRIESSFKSWYKLKYGKEANMSSIIIVSEYAKIEKTTS